MGAVRWLKGFIYKAAMRIGHRFNWHYAPPIYPEGDTQLWCKWCGFRQTIKVSSSNIGKIEAFSKNRHTSLGRTETNDVKIEGKLNMGYLPTFILVAIGVWCFDCLLFC